MFFQVSSYSKNSRVIKRRKNRGKPYILLLPIVVLSLWSGYRQILSYLVKPEAVLVLGGDEKRERFAAKLAKQDPNLAVWVSSGSPKGYAQRIFSKAGVKSDRVHLDYRAVDTVTNFTTLVDELKTKGIDSIYLITSDNHMLRARVIGEVVLGSRGIAIKPISVPSKAPTEPIEKSLRDGARAILWLLTGYTGAKK
jgi:uncharacterized SAM-binding protein YcdF (DUF218 family)